MQRVSTLPSPAAKRVPPSPGPRLRFIECNHDGQLAGAKVRGGLLLLCPACVQKRAEEKANG